MLNDMQNDVFCHGIRSPRIMKVKRLQYMSSYLPTDGNKHSFWTSFQRWGNSELGRIYWRCISYFQKDKSDRTMLVHTKKKSLRRYVELCRNLDQIDGCRKTFTSNGHYNEPDWTREGLKSPRSLLQHRSNNLSTLNQAKSHRLNLISKMAFVFQVAYYVSESVVGKLGVE